MAASSSLQVSVVAADHEVWSGQAAMVVATTIDGEMGIMPGHIPTLAILDKGEVRVTLADGSKVIATATEGFLSVDRDVVSVVAGDASLVS
ncbi:F0F1 ATP synthase subunit epsilon [Mycetocola reblochoni]|uniref:ATP synthase epsilon chain n=2 Tax=Mycetocola reblochoni TaxID=331618 RepID=A0A1R4JTY2_9MICO|nr:F0F1 ATP synthase subunit epsilon [Mycetocola reblochoni]RLP70380.1 F0F1 ATP synthase subunit epsilon [Mycetocola reblochoni]SJN35439.1 ATP synthase epsilon chain [Mycetocola reblochoni REB411]